MLLAVSSTLVRFPEKGQRAMLRATQSSAGPRWCRDLQPRKQRAVSSSLYWLVISMHPKNRLWKKIRVRIHQPVSDLFGISGICMKMNDAYSMYGDRCYIILYMNMSNHASWGSWKDSKANPLLQTLNHFKVHVRLLGKTSALYPLKNGSKPGPKHDLTHQRAKCLIHHEIKQWGVPTSLSIPEPFRGPDLVLQCSIWFKS